MGVVAGWLSVFNINDYSVQSTLWSRSIIIQKIKVCFWILKYFFRSASFNFADSRKIQFHNDVCSEYLNSIYIVINWSQVASRCVGAPTRATLVWVIVYIGSVLNIRTCKLKSEKVERKTGGFDDSIFGQTATCLRVPNLWATNRIQAVLIIILYSSKRIERNL